MIRFLVAFILLTSSAFAQWHPIGPRHQWDTGWTTPNTWGCVPIENEPDLWKQVSVPLPPDGATHVDVVIEWYHYRSEVEATNNGPESAYYRTSGLYTYRVGHEPGLYAGVIGPAPVYLRGHGYNQMPAHAAFLNQGVAGGSPFFNHIMPGVTETTIHERTQNGLNIQRWPIDVRWVTPNRRGEKSLFITTEGDYDWRVEWTDGTAPQGWGGHWPISYTSTKQVRVTGYVQYGAF